jgi:hypothetical protein
MKCTEGNLKYVRIDLNDDLDQNEDDVKAWFNIYDEYIKKFGLGKMYERLLKVMKKKALLECDFVLTREKFKLTEIEIEEANLKTMLSNRGNGLTIEQTLIHLSKWVGYHINTKKITASDYFNLLEQYGKENSKK